jgi:hypothetical protein
MVRVQVALLQKDQMVTWHIAGYVEPVIGDRPACVVIACISARLIGPGLTLDVLGVYVLAIDDCGDNGGHVVLNVFYVLWAERTTL